MNKNTPSAGKMSRIVKAFTRAVVSQFHPRMLFALLLPFLVVLVGAAILLWLFWDPVTTWLGSTVMQWGWLQEVDAWLVGIGLVSLNLWLVPIAATLILLPLSGLLGLAIAAVFVMPLVLRHLGSGAYADVQERGRLGFVVSGWNAIWVMTIFVVGWALTMPLWLIPPLALILPTLWWTFAFTRMLRLDALSDYASAEERRMLIARHNGEFWLLGLICALLSLLPPAWLFLPVFSSLLFAHFGLDALRALRAQMEHPGIEPPASTDAVQTISYRDLPPAQQ